MTNVRLERRSASDLHVVSIEIPDDASPMLVATAASKLVRVIDLVEQVEKGCPICFAFGKLFHDGQCPYAGPNREGGVTMIEAARQTAIAEGMHP